MDNIIKTDLPGLHKKSFKMSYMGGEIWFEHLDGLFGYTDLVKDKFTADFAVIKKLSSPSLLSVIVDETKITDELVHLLIDSFIMAGAYVRRVVFTGLDKAEKKKMCKYIKERYGEVHFAVNYVNDLEKAKLWLISEAM